MKDLEGTTTKVLPMILISLTSTIAIAVISIRQRRATGSVYTFFSANPDTIGLVIQVVSAALGACQIYAITSLINLSSRLRMQRGGPVEFRRLKFLAAITSGSSQALRTSLPATWLTVVVLAIFTLKIPAALWAGAMTPVLAVYTTDQGQIAVPTYPLSALPYWQGSFRRLSDGTVDQTLHCNWAVTSDQLIAGSVALVSTCPAIDLVSALLGSLATAAAGTVSVPRPHPRIDSSGWTILGRSFGVGSSPGIVPLQNLMNHQAPMMAFDYIENGYYTNVTCARNATSNYKIIYEEDSAGALSYWVTGTLPNSIPGQVEEYPLASGTTSNNFLAWSALSNAGQNILAVAGTGNYSMFDKMQCTVDFIPTRFAVHVNVTNSIITAQADTSDTSPVPDIEPTHQFATSVFYGLEQISRMAGNTIVSSLGVPLDHNTNIIADRNGTLDNNVTTALSLEYGVGTLIENLLVAEAQSQMFILKDTTNVPLSVHYRAIRIGSDKYIYSVLVTNIAILVVILSECTRTKLWKGLTIFDFADIQSMAVGASAGGKLLAEKWMARQQMGSDSDQFAVALRARQTGWALIRADKATFMYDVIRQEGSAERSSVSGYETVKVISTEEVSRVSIVESDMDQPLVER